MVGALFAAKITSAVRCYELLSGDGSGDPIPCGLEALLSEKAASQLLLHLSDEEEVRWGEIKLIGPVRKDLDVPGGQPDVHRRGGMGRSIIPVEKPLSVEQFRLLFPHLLHKDSLGLGDVGRVLCLTPGDDVGVNDTLGVKEDEDHLFLMTGMDM